METILTLHEWLKRIISFEIRPDLPLGEEDLRYRVLVGNLPPYPCLLTQTYAYNLKTRQLSCLIPKRYHDWIMPSDDEKKAAEICRVYYKVYRDDVIHRDVSRYVIDDIMHNILLELEDTNNKDEISMKASFIRKL